MKSADPERSASFIAAGPPRSIQRTVTSVYFSIRWYFSITSSGRNPTPPAPLGMWTSRGCGLPPQALSSKSASVTLNRIRVSRGNCGPRQLRYVVQLIDPPAQLDGSLYLSRGQRRHGLIAKLFLQLL